MPLNRTAVKAALNLGTVDLSDKEGANLARTTTEKSKRYKKLDKFDNYYNSKQYEQLREWGASRDECGAYVPLRHRKPLIIYNLPKVLVERAASKLVGQRSFPKFSLKQDPDTEELAKVIMRVSKFKAKSIDVAKEVMKNGSVFVKFAILQGSYKIDVFNSKHCSPQFNEFTDELQGVRVQYKYKDEERKGNEKNDSMFWYRLDVTDTQEILYDNPPVTEMDEEREPEFKVTASIQHNLGFVPGEWIVNGEVQNTIDGDSILESILEISDAMNYQLSQSDQAITYTQEPQLAFKNMDQEEIDMLIKSATKAWNLGREGNAEFVEIGGSGIELAAQHVKRIDQKAQDLAKVVILDPERLAGVYQSGKAMEVLHGPFVDLIYEVRPWLGDYGLLPLLQKMIAATMVAARSGAELEITIPPNYVPKSLDFELVWKPVFEPTLEDIQKAVSIAVQASTANLISRKTGTEFVSEFFGVEDAELEQQEVIAQPLPPSPFGPFGF